MSGNPINIEIRDKVESGISAKIFDIAKAARQADSAVEKLKKQLDTIGTSPIDKLKAAVQSNTNAIDKNAIANQKLALVTQKLATEELRTATATANATSANNRAEMSTIRLQQAKDRLAKSTTGAGNAIMGYVRNLAALVGVGLGIQNILQTADAYTSLQNKLVNVTESYEQLEEVTKRVYGIAARTRVPVQETAQAFQRFDQALQLLGASQNETLRLTETVNKALKVGGNNASESASVLLQLSQAFNKGKLDGDEFRSVMEAMGSTVKDAIAKELKTTRNELVKLAPEGKITAEVLRRAFAAVASEIDAKFAKTVPTLSDAFSVLRTRASEFFGEINKSLGITSALSTLILAVADNLKLVSIALGAVGAAMLVSFGPAIVTAITTATRAVWGFTAAIASNPIGLIAVAISTAIVAIVAYRKEIWAALNTTVAFNMSSIELFLKFADVVAGVYRGIWTITVKTMDMVADYFAKPINYINKAWASISKTVLDVFNSVINYVGNAVNKVMGYIGDMLGYVKTNVPEALTTAVQEVGKYAPEKIKEIGSELGAAFMEGYNAQQENGLLAWYRKNQKNSLDKNKDSQTQLRGAGPGLPPDGTPDKAVIRRAFELAKINNELDTQFKAMQKVGFAYQVEQKMTEISNALFDKKIKLTKSESDAIREKVTALEYEKGVHQQLEAIYDSTQGKQLGIQQQVDAVTQAYQRGIITMDDYANRMVKLQIEAANLNIAMGNASFGDFATASLGKLVEQYQGVAQGLTESFGSFFQSFTDGFANSVGRAVVYSENLGDALRNVAASAMSELISSLVKLGIQWAIQATIGQSIQAASLTASTAANVAAASATAAAWAPAAALASLASFGANSVPATTGIVTTMGIAQALAAMTGVGFKEGGYTGNVGINDVAGVVHGKEFVFDAESTSRIGVSNLEALRNRSVSTTKSTSGGSGMQTNLVVNVINQVSSDIEFQSRQIGPSEVEIIARRVVREDAPGVIANDMGSANSRTSKALTKNTTTQRRRGA